MRKTVYKKTKKNPNRHSCIVHILRFLYLCNATNPRDWWPLALRWHNRLLQYSFLFHQNDCKKSRSISYIHTYTRGLGAMNSHFNYNVYIIVNKCISCDSSEKPSHFKLVLRPSDCETVCLFLNTVLQNNLLRLSNLELIIFHLKISICDYYGLEKRDRFFFPDIIC